VEASARPARAREQALGQCRQDGSSNATAMPRHHATAHATASPAAMQGTGTGTVEGKPSPAAESNTHKPSLTTREKPPPGITDQRWRFELRLPSRRLARSERHAAAEWNFNHCWLAGFGLHAGADPRRHRQGSKARPIADAIAQALRQHDPGNARDQLGGELPVTEAEAWEAEAAKLASEEAAVWRDRADLA
jgi:hypothetical protein